MSHAKIGVILGISKVRVIQIEADALRKLRFRLAAIAEEIA
jgi:DNA-directed RNA polymerase sigma subunit (sigma70/sigma32)